MKQPFWSSIRIIWIILCLAVLAYCQYVYDGQPNSDTEEVLIILMFILTLPVASFVAGSVAVGAAIGFERLLHATLYTSRVEMFLAWLLFFVLGYLQWFTILPRVWTKWRKRCAEANAGMSALPGQDKV